MNLVIQFISNVINTVIVLGLVFISIIIATLMIMVLLPAGSIRCAIKTKNIKKGLRYIKRVVAGISEETDKFFSNMANSLIYIWRVG